MGKMTEVIILGAGVVGITTALQLNSLMPNIKISIVADQFTKDTLSAGAAGIFRPSTSFSGPNPQVTRKWIVNSYNFYKGLLGVAGSGVSEISGYILSNIHPSIVQNPHLEGLVKEYRAVTSDEMKLIPGIWKYGSYFTTLLIQCRYFLPWAMDRLKEQGVKFVEKKVNSLSEFEGKCDILVNCTGLGARYLAADIHLVPIRGQLFKVKAEWVDKFYYGDFDTYIIPTGDGLVTVGGSRHFESYSTEFCRYDGNAIMERAISLLPDLARAPVVKTWVGLRPYRHKVKVALENKPGLKIIHNYGHGGYGVTTAPGTGLEVVNIIQTLSAKSKL